MDWKVKATAIGIACTFLLFDVPWFIRLAFCLCSSRFGRKIKKIGKDEGIIYGICSTHDLDFMGHMNNVRYLRELDFARFDFFLRSGLGPYILTNQSNKPNMYCVIRSASIRYRRSINLFDFFSVQSRLVWWDEKSIYFEHRFITLRDQFVRAIAYSHCYIGNCDVEEMMRILDATPRPTLPPTDVQRWIDFMSSSSGKLKLELLSVPNGIVLNASSDSLSSSVVPCKTY
uniref:Protein THEM6 n=2 Tax=Lepeophtheirus salmonis TaxID=72036 RepID=A0A0K2T8A9_LEPSM